MKNNQLNVTKTDNLKLEAKARVRARIIALILAASLALGAADSGQSRL